MARKTICDQRSLLSPSSGMAPAGISVLATKMLRVGMVALTVFVSCLQIGSVEAHPDNTPTSVYLPPGKISRSPDGKLSCLTKNLSDGQTLYLRRDDKEILLHTAGRNLGVDWAPNSQWLAVIDNYAAGENRIVVYDVSNKEPTVIAETPAGEAWRIVAWDIPNKRLLVQSFEYRRAGTLTRSTALTWK